ncbi:MAG: AAA family ATPase [Chloroflexia bacterium]|nr:AAA family ATPase [Chloroflexia bacterium]
MYALRDKLRDAPGTRPFTYPLGRAVAFPDVLVGDTALGPAASRDLVIDSRDLSGLARGVERAWRAFTGSDTIARPGDAGVAALVALLRPTIELARPGLAGAIKGERDELLRLTEQQIALLDFLGSHRRVAISGTAGSGKTVLALEQVHRLARQGFRVLFTCYTKALAAWARESLGRDLGPDMNRVVVNNYHDLAADFARRSGMTLPAERELSAEDAAYFFANTLPQHLLDALAGVPDRFDAIVVDEGQDFADIWWVTIEALLADAQSGVLFIFYDDNQRIFSVRGGYPIPPPHFSLTHNCRTTQRIHEAAAAYHTSGPPPDCRGPEGRPPVVVDVAPGEEVAALRKVVHTLVVEEGVPLDDLVVLTPRGSKTSRLPEGARLGNFTLTWGDGGPDALRCRSIQAFKELERPVVILAEPERAHAASRIPLLHVALSRAQHQLIILGALPPGESPQLEAR